MVVALTTTTMAVVTIGVLWDTDHMEEQESQLTIIHQLAHLLEALPWQAQVAEHLHNKVTIPTPIHMQLAQEGLLLIDKPDFDRADQKQNIQNREKSASRDSSMNNPWYSGSNRSSFDRSNAQGQVNHDAYARSRGNSLPNQSSRSNYGSNTRSNAGSRASGYSGGGGRSYGGGGGRGGGGRRR